MKHVGAQCGKRPIIYASMCVSGVHRRTHRSQLAPPAPRPLHPTVLCIN